MKRKRIIWITILLIAAAAGWYVYKEFNRTNKSLARIRPDYMIEAAALIRDYETNDSSATKKYNGRIIEVAGWVKKVDKDEQGYYTLVLGEAEALSSVRCSMDTAHNKDAAIITVGSSAKVRGACTGFNKDEMGLGSDVILNRCVIIK